MSLWTISLIGGVIALISLYVMEYLASTDAQELASLGAFLIGAWIMTAVDVVSRDWLWVVTDALAALLVLGVVLRDVFWKKSSDAGE